MKSRKEAVDLINKQLQGPIGKGHAFTTPLDKLAKGNQHHYGVQELRELMDFIYGGPPTNGELIKRWGNT